MKNLLLIFLAAVFLASCKKEDPDPPSSPTQPQSIDTITYDVRWMPADSCYTSSSRTTYANVTAVDTTVQGWAVLMQYYHCQANSSPAPFYGHLVFSAPKKNGVSVGIHLAREPIPTSPVPVCDMSRFVIYRDSVLIVDTLGFQADFSEWLHQ